MTCVLRVIPPPISPLAGLHGMNWMLDLIDYEALDMARSTVELRQEDRKRMNEDSGQGPSFVVSLLLPLT